MHFSTRYSMHKVLNCCSLHGSNLLMTAGAGAGAAKEATLRTGKVPLHACVADIDTD